MSRGVDLTQGEAIVLQASQTVNTVVTNVAGTAKVTQGERKWLMVLLNITAAATAAGDTLDVYVDFLGPDGATWINGGHFTQAIGTGGALKSWMVFNLNANPGTTDLLVTTDAASGVVRPYVNGSQVRTRWTTAQATAVSYTFSVTAYAI